MARDLTKPGYRIPHADGSYSIRSPMSAGETVWRNMADKRRQIHPELVRQVEKIEQHPMFKYVKIGALLDYSYQHPNSKDLDLRRAMKLEALTYILGILDAMEKAS